MQTFLPYPDFKESASALDTQRLGKQRVECLQIMNALVSGTGWIHHPAVTMWKGYEAALLAYGEIVCLTWIYRGRQVTGNDYRDTVRGKLYEAAAPLPNITKIVMPPWLGYPDFHASHRSSLLRKGQTKWNLTGNSKTFWWYAMQDWQETMDIPYFWPTKETKWSTYGSQEHSQQYNDDTRRIGVKSIYPQGSDFLSGSQVYEGSLPPSFHEALDDTNGIDGRTTPSDNVG